MSEKGIIRVDEKQLGSSSHEDLERSFYEAFVHREMIIANNEMRIKKVNAACFLYPTGTGALSVLYVKNTDVQG